MKTLRFVIVLLFLAVPCFGQDLPDKPEPRPAGRVADREFWIQAGALGAAWTADTVTTSHGFAESPLFREGGAIFYGSRSTPEIMGTYAAIDLAAGVTAYEWKKHVHNRYLHPLWRVPMAFMAGNHTYGAVHNSIIRIK